MAKIVEKKIRKLPETRKFGYQIFVSHATADKWIAKVICNKIEEKGALTFIDDRDIHGGDDIPEEIHKQIKRSRELVVLLTPTSYNRDWVRLEVGAAWAWKKRIVAILCHVGIDLIPEIIKSKKAISINEIDNYLNEISTRVNKTKNVKK
ncbi:MAG: hypothetical protein A2Y10_12590 [Planctomycetes bacterium GWF2_41_51]|nr:MAG: hypothetical protein A2Y10_12590 [Planctomycetes bacterium GWF2_41_51]HBG27259.1 hypothetical protein [Phycisphaerales bacterium]